MDRDVTMCSGETSVDAEISTDSPAVAGTDHVLGPNFTLINDMKTDFTRNSLCPDIQYTERAPGLEAEINASSVPMETKLITMGV
jgi:hypothetical protein